MYYVIETDYVGPNAQQHLNDHAFEIHSEPARGNSGDRPVIIDGWCGTSNDWAVTAHGEHETIEAARAEIARQTGDAYREDDEADAHIRDSAGVIVERYLVGCIPHLTAEESCDLAHPCVDEITADTTDAEIDGLVDECVRDFRDPSVVGADANADAIRDMLIEARDDARAESE